MLRVSTPAKPASKDRAPVGLRSAAKMPVPRNVPPRVSLKRPALEGAGVAVVGGEPKSAALTRSSGAAVGGLTAKAAASARFTSVAAHIFSPSSVTTQHSVLTFTRLRCYLEKLDSPPISQIQSCAGINITEIRA